MKRLTVVALILLLVGAVACGGGDQTVMIPATGVEPEALVYENPPTETMWIGPGKVLIENYFPGDRAECPVTTYNPGPEESEYTIRVADPNPDRLYEGYEMPPEGVNEWVIFIDPSPVYRESVGSITVRIEPGQRKDVMVALEVPLQEETPNKYEFLVVVQETGQGNLVTELASRWMVVGA